MPGNTVGGITVVGTGRYAPGAPVTNEALARVMDTSAEWIEQRSGIRQRHFAEDGTGCSDLAVEASKRALEAAALPAEAIDYIIFATMTPDYAFPGPGGLLGAKLGIPGVPALDIRQQCAAIPYGLQLANGLVQSGAAKTVLLVGAEVHAGLMPWDDWDVLRGTSTAKVSPDKWERATRHRNFSVLFGDGAGAMLLRSAEREGAGLINVEVHSDGRHYDHIYLEGGGFKHCPFISSAVLAEEAQYPKMLGKELFKTAVQRLPRVVRSVVEKSGVAFSDIDWFIAHQANDRINQAVGDALGVPAEKLPSNIANYGNTSGATIPILLDELIRDGRVKQGDLICFLALGAGLHWGAALMRL